MKGADFGQLTEDIYRTFKEYESNLIEDNDLNQRVLMSVNVLIKSIVNRQKEEGKEDNDIVDVFIPSAKMQNRIDSVINPHNKDAFDKMGLDDNDDEFFPEIKFDDNSIEFEGDMMPNEANSEFESNRLMEKWDVESIRK